MCGTLSGWLKRKGESEAGVLASHIPRASLQNFYYSIYPTAYWQEDDICSENYFYVFIPE